MLAANQLQILRIDLKDLAGIEYDDVLNELLDHYATLTEQRMPPACRLTMPASGRGPNSVPVQVSKPFRMITKGISSSR